MKIDRLPAHVDVLIVGAGPVGAMLAQRLDRLGLRLLLVETKPAASDDPRALVLTPETR